MYLFMPFQTNGFPTFWPILIIWTIDQIKYSPGKWCYVPFFFVLLKLRLLMASWWLLLYICLLSVDRLTDFIVTVSNISFPVTAAQLVPPAYTRCGQYQGYPGPGQTGTVTCSPGPTRGRYVFISLPIPGVLTMCETRVFAGMSRVGFVTITNPVHKSHLKLKSQKISLVARYSLFTKGFGNLHWCYNPGAETALFWKQTATFPKKNNCITKIDGIP